MKQRGKKKRKRKKKKRERKRGSGENTREGRIIIANHKQSVTTVNIMIDRKKKNQIKGEKSVKEINREADNEEIRRFAERNEGRKRGRSERMGNAKDETREE